MTKRLTEEEKRKKKKQQIIERNRKMFIAAEIEKTHKEQREKATISKGGISKPIKGEGVNQDWVSRLGEWREKLSSSKVAMVNRGRDFFGSGSSPSSGRK